MEIDDGGAAAPAVKAAPAAKTAAASYDLPWVGTMLLPVTIVPAADFACGRQDASIQLGMAVSHYGAPCQCNLAGRTASIIPH